MRFKNLERYRTGGVGTRMELGIPLPRSPKGMVVLTCPRGCTPGRFQLGDPTTGPDGSSRPISQELRSHARREPGQDTWTCPYCGVDGHKQEFVSAEDRAFSRDYVAWAAQQDAADTISKAVEDMCRRLNGRSSRGGLFSLRMNYKRGSRRPEPRPYREDLLRDLRCSACTRRYGVYAVALFCPDCGAPNLAVHFQREVELIHAQVELARRAGEEGKDELAFRLLGNAHEDVVTAVETYLKHIHAYLVRRDTPAEAEERCSKKAVGNAFQSVRRAREMLAPFGVDPYDALSTDELNWFTDNIEKRHVLGHNLGLADKAYADAVGTEKPGRTVLLLAEEVLRFPVLAQTMIRSLERLLTTGATTEGSSGTPTTTAAPPDTPAE